jgi:tetratricopeptide (TPR) repeat protein
MIQQLEKSAFSASGTLADRIQVMNYYYGYVGHLLDFGKKDEAGEWAKKAQVQMKKLAQEAPNDARVLALQSMFVAYEIAINPLKAPFSVGGMKSNAKKAMAANASLPSVNIANANISYYFPESLGGDKKAALKLYLKAYDYYVAHPAEAADDWMYLNVLSTIGLANEAIGDYDEALRWCDKALTVCPGFVYVKTVLKPRVEGKRK